MRITHYLKQLALTLLILLSTGCSMISYYSQSVQGQLSILYHREDINTLLEDPNVDVTLKTKLKQVKAIRQYASKKLGLPDNKSYLYYTDIHRPYVVWNVFAAPEFSLKPINWCYPIVGCVSYRGYFEEKRAVELASKLATAGNDTHVAGITAYSTLGWFNDPVLSTMINWRERSLAGLIFHELSHQVIYIKNDTTFNEAFASSVERIGSIQWLLNNNPKELTRYLNYLEAQNSFRNLLLDTRDKLNQLYTSKMSIERKRRSKQRVIAEMKNEYEQMKQRWPDDIQFDYWFKKPINNARFTSTMTYLQKIPAFYQVFIESKGNWTKFYENVLAMEKLTQEERNTLMNEKTDDQFDLSKIVKLLKNRHTGKRG